MELLENALRPVHSFFNHAGLRRFWLQARYFVGIVAICLLVPLVTLEWFWVGLSVSLLGECIQLWCWSSLRTSKVLACLGPYAMARNPMYLGRYFIVLGIILLFGKPGVWAILPYTVIYIFYMVNRVKREERKLVELFGTDYVEYCSKVNRFVPSLRNAELRSVLYWDWKTFHENHGVMNLVGLLVVYAVFYLFAIWL